VPDDACRIDVWLWRARFFKTRALAARAVEDGRIRLTRDGVGRRVDKPARLLRIGDELVFACAGRLTCIVVAAMGERRGPVTEARQLYEPLDGPCDMPPPPCVGGATPRLSERASVCGEQDFLLPQSRPKWC